MLALACVNHQGPFWSTVLALRRRNAGFEQEASDTRPNRSRRVGLNRPRFRRPVGGSAKQTTRATRPFDTSADRRRHPAHAPNRAIHCCSLLLAPCPSLPHNPWAFKCSIISLFQRSVVSGTTVSWVAKRTNQM